MLQTAIVESVKETFTPEQHVKELKALRSADLAYARKRLVDIAEHYAALEVPLVNGNLLYELKLAAEHCKLLQDENVIAAVKNIRGPNDWS